MTPVQVDQWVKGTEKPGVCTALGTAMTKACLLNKPIKFVSKTKIEYPHNMQQLLSKATELVEKWRSTYSPLIPVTEHKLVVSPLPPS